MQLSFWAKSDLLVPIPGFRPSANLPPDYVGRGYAKDEATGRHGHPALAEPFRCDSETDVGRRLVLLTRRDDCLLPADEATAQACGKRFIAHELSDGVMVPVSPKKPASS
jgi:hypothetical protein